MVLIYISLLTSDFRYNFLCFLLLVYFLWFNIFKKYFRNRDRQRQRENSHPMLHSLNTCSSQNWAQDWSQEPRTQSRSPFWVLGVQLTWAIICSFQGSVLAGSWNWELELGVKLRHFNMGCKHLNYYVRIHTPNFL